MTKLKHAEVVWALNSHCQHQCVYCPTSLKNGEVTQSVEQYLLVIAKLQKTRYQHHSEIYWKLTGGEPLHFPYLSTLLKKMRERPALIRLDTSGDDSWFSLYSVLNLLDQVKLTYHYWQSSDMFEHLLEQCQEKNVSASIVIPLHPGRIMELRDKVEYFKSRGYMCSEQILYEEDGRLYQGYSQVDENRIFGRPDDYDATPFTPAYIDLSVLNSADPVYTGLPCYAGIDWLSINPKGFASYSQCGGRNEHYNVFEPNWQPPSDWFACNVNQCRSDKDRKKIRIISSTL